MTFRDEAGYTAPDCRPTGSVRACCPPGVECPFAGLAIPANRITKYSVGHFPWPVALWGMLTVSALWLGCTKLVIASGVAGLAAIVLLIVALLPGGAFAYWRARSWRASL